MKKKNRIILYAIEFVSNFSRLRIVIITLLMGFTLILVNGCKKDEKEPQVPVLTTSDIRNVREATAISGGAITSDCGSMVTTRGVCWDKGTTPTINNNKTVDGEDLGAFTSNITGLIPNTIYYLRAYATNSHGTGYGNTLTFTTLQAIKDFDGNEYHTITINNKLWMVENLKVTHYRNGDPIPNITDINEWFWASGAYCDYNNNPTNSATYGRLYNFYAVSDSRNICPAGWHVANNAELNDLISYFGFQNSTGGKLKETGTVHWQSPNTGATNKIGFTALPGGKRSSEYAELGTNGWWWTSTIGDAFSARYFMMSSGDDYLSNGYFDRHAGFSVRCVKD
jgi:uncharacterized protein (TIGR02145 family)